MAYESEDTWRKIVMVIVVMVIVVMVIVVMVIVARVIVVMVMTTHLGASRSNARISCSQSTIIDLALCVSLST